MFTFKTTLHNLPDIAVDVSPLRKEAPDRLKKRCRIKISVEQTSPSLGFLHACLVKTKSGTILIAGKSGSGKSTIANKIPQAQILANDWVAVEKEDDQYFASDLNFSDSNMHPGRHKVTGIIFLLGKDAHKRDAFYPLKTEFKRHLNEVFDTVAAPETKKLSSFWLDNYSSLPFLIAVPNENHMIADTMRVITDILWRFKLLKKPANLSIGVMGTGAVGSTLAYQIGHLKEISTVNLFDRTPAKAAGIALDLNHAAGSDIFCDYQSVASLKELLSTNSLIFVAFRDTTPQGLELPANIPERERRLYAHVKIIDTIARVASEVKFRGTLFVITNPSDILAYALWEKSQNHDHPLKTYQVFGLGMELDKARALYYHRVGGVSISHESISVYGNHTYDVRIEYNSKIVSGKIIEQVKTASYRVRTVDSVRTIYGPTKAFVRNAQALLFNKSTTLTCIESDSFIGGEVTFSAGVPSLFTHKQSASLRTSHKRHLANYPGIL